MEGEVRREGGGRGEKGGEVRRVEGEVWKER